MKRTILILLALILTTVGVVVARFSETKKTDHIENVNTHFNDSNHSSLTSWD